MRTKRPLAGGLERSLTHVMIVGGTVDSWSEYGAEAWAVRRAELAKAVAHAGGTWLTLCPYGPGAHDAGSLDAFGAAERTVDVQEGCTVIVDACADGRTRLLRAVDSLRSRGPAAINEAGLAAALMAPAPTEPDLTIILGPADRLPPSLVWELAYTELVFLDVSFADLGAAHIEQATDAYSRRHRRFGGIG